MLIGHLKEKYQILKIKELVDLAGHSLPLALLKVLFSLLEELTFCPNSNLLTVQEAMEIWDAMEVGWTLLSNMFEIMA